MLDVEGAKVTMSFSWLGGRHGRGSSKGNVKSHKSNTQHFLVLLRVVDDEQTNACSSDVAASLCRLAQAQLSFIYNSEGLYKSLTEGLKKLRFGQAVVRRILR